MKRQIVFILIVFTACVLNGKDYSYFSAGYSIENYFNNKGLSTIFNDFNDHHDQTAQNVKHELKLPGNSLGLVLGMKLESEEMSMSFKLLGHVYSSTAEGRDSIGVHYEKKVNLTHNGFNLCFTRHILQSDFFRSGPSFGFNFEQFQTIVKNIVADNIQKTTDIFYFSFALRWPISIGEGKFTFDIIPYYQFPLYKMNLTKLNKRLNEGYHTNYSKDKMKFNPAAAGIIFTINWGV
jgi:hypothetical protein